MRIDDVHVDEEIVRLLLSRFAIGEQHGALARAKWIVENLHQAVARRAHDLIQFAVPQRSNDTRRVTDLNLSFGLSQIIPIEEVQRADVRRIVLIFRRFFPCRRSGDEKTIVRREDHVGHGESIVQFAEGRKWIFEVTNVPQLQRVIGRTRSQLLTVVRPT